ncbi:MAG TPA: hypothetical protein VGK94_05610 [Candidatus Polarisedimenticolia bacterium]|jgi:hypothetical protein
MPKSSLVPGLLLTVLSALGPVGPAAAPAAPDAPPARKRVALPEEDPNFIALLDMLADRAALYRKRALGFSCREVVTVAKYDVSSTSFRKSTKSVYDYLFEERPEGALREVREELIEEKNGVKRRGTDFDPPVPPAYAWASIFAKENQWRFHFRPAGQVVKAGRLLTLITFIGTSPNPGGDDIAGWSGQVALENRSLNLWSVEAAPTGQDVRLDVEILRYRKAFAIAGVPLATRPHGWKLNVNFGMDVEDLSYPTEQSLAKTSLSQDGKMNTEEKTSFRYEEYRFFGVETGEEVKRTGETPPDPNVPER